MHAQSTTTLPASRIFTAGSGDPSQASESLPAGGVAVDSNSLLRGRKAVTITHNGASYRLQATKLGKLILTK